MRYGGARAIKRRWRFDETASGRSDVREQLQRPDKIPGDDAAGIIAAMHLVNKKWQKTKKADLDLADHRLADWRARGRSTRPSEP